MTSGSLTWTYRWGAGLGSLVSIFGLTLRVPILYELWFIHGYGKVMGYFRFGLGFMVALYSLGPLK